MLAQTANPALLLGLMLLAAIVGGYAARLGRTPRVVGYLVAGLALRWVVLAYLNRGEPSGDAVAAVEEAAGALQGLKALALGLILFSVGGVFERSHLRRVGKMVMRMASLEALCVVLPVMAGCTLVWWLRNPDSVGPALAAGVLIGVAALATAPAATLLVLREYDARGPMSDTILSLTALNNTLSIVLFHCLLLVLTAVGAIETVAAEQRLVWLDLLLTSVGSMLLGGLLGFGFSVLHAKVPLSEFFLMFFALLLGLGAGEAYLTNTLHLSFNFLLTCLFMGAVFANVTIDQEALHTHLRTMGAPIFAGFFVLAGYELHISDLSTLGWLGAAYVILRAGGKYVAGYLGTRRVASGDELRSYIGLGLMCQAGVAIGLADYLYSTWGTITEDGFVPHPLAAEFKTVILGSVVVFEIFGPLLLKGVVVRSGEVKAITLLRRTRTTSAEAEGESILALTWHALLRTIGLGGVSGGTSHDVLQVRHIMRSNVKFIPASANLDDVLHFVESSRYNHFPVVDDNGVLIGVIHFADLREIIYDPTLRELVTAVDLASQDTPPVSVDLSLDDLLAVFEKTDVSSLPVVKSDKSHVVVGLVEQHDLLHVLGKANSGAPS